MDIDRSAPVVVRREATITAPVEVVWDLHTDVRGWTQWRSDVTAATLAGPFAPGSTFHWSTAGLDIASTVREVEPRRQSLWGGPAHGVVGLHLWTFTPDGDDVHVVTEESWSGPAVEADVEGARTALDRSLDRWLTELTRTAEAQR